MNVLTNRQREVLNHIKQFIEANGYPPTVKEIGTMIGVKSNNAVNDHLKCLERAGAIVRDNHVARGMRVTDESMVHLVQPNEESWPDLQRAAQTALERISLGQRQLRDLGWIIHCPPPKDRDSLTVEAGSTGIRRTRWLTCAYFCEDGGDLWPTTPIAWMDIPKEKKS